MTHGNEAFFVASSAIYERKEKSVSVIITFDVECTPPLTEQGGWVLDEAIKEESRRLQKRAEVSHNFTFDGAMDIACADAVRDKLIAYLERFHPITSGRSWREVIESHLLP